MANVIFVAPFFMSATVDMIANVAALPGVRCAVLCQDVPERLPKAVRRHLVDMEQVEDALSPAHLLAGTRALGRRLGSVDRIFGALEHIQVQIAEVREALGIEGLTVEAANNFRDKSRMKTVLRNAGLPCARHCLAATSQTALSFVNEIGLPVVVKPPAGAGAQATYRIASLDAFEDFLRANPPSQGNEVLIEEFIQGDEFTFETMSIGGIAVWHSCARYIPPPLEALEKPWVQLCMVIPAEEDPRRMARIRPPACRALDALGMGTGLTHMEWFERADGSVALSEVAARPPGAQLTAITGYAHDIDLFKAWAQVMVYGAFDPPARRYAAGAAFLRGPGSGRVLAVRGFQEVAEELGGIIVDHKIPQPGQPHPSGYEGAGWVIVRHPDTDMVVRALGKVITNTQIIVG